MFNYEYETTDATSTNVIFRIRYEEAWNFNTLPTLPEARDDLEDRKRPGSFTSYIGPLQTRPRKRGWVHNQQGVKNGSEQHPKGWPRPPKRAGRGREPQKRWRSN